MEESESLDKDCSLKKKIFNIIQIGDKSNRISRAFDIFITITIVLNISGDICTDVWWIVTDNNGIKSDRICDTGHFLCGICPANLDGRVLISQYRQKTGKTSFFDFIWWSDWFTDHCTCIFLIGICNIQNVTGGKNFPPVPVKCKIWLV